MAPYGWTSIGLTRFVWDGWNLLAEISASDAMLRSYAWGLDLSGSEQGAGGVGGLVFEADGAGTVLHALADGNGNVMRLRDASGTLAADYEYGPFGEVLIARGASMLSNPFRFSTKYADAETGLLYYGYRYYNASTGRWISRDPIEEEGGNGVYAFTANAPIAQIDLLGHEAIEIAFDAFINGSRRGAWLAQPGPGPNILGAPSFIYRFRTDPRDFGEFNFNILSPNARIASMGWVDSLEIGKATYGASAGGRSATGLSHRRFVRQHGIGDPQFEYGPIETARGRIHNPIPKVVNGRCETWLRFSPRATYSFSPGPAIRYNIDVHFKVSQPGYVTIEFHGNHNAFPDYEAYINRSLVYGRFSPHSGPSLLNLGGAPWSHSD